MRRPQLILALVITCSLALGSLLARAQCTRSCGAGSGEQLVTLYTFKGQPDGANSQAVLVADGSGALYGTTKAGGMANLGTVFKLDSSGVETILHSFTGSPDGANSLAGLLFDSAASLYGTTYIGGTIGGSSSNGCGVIFKIDPTGNETVVYPFTGMPDGCGPHAALTRDSSGNFYGTTAGGGSNGRGTVFKLDATGEDTVLHNFSDVPDGANPIGGVLLDNSGILYGATQGGGILNCGGTGRPPKPTVGCGTVFTLPATGAESILYSFAGKEDGSDATFPTGGLVRDPDGNLYGAALDGGRGICYIISMMSPEPSTFIYCGTVFKVDPTGKETVLHRFSGGPNPIGVDDGAGPNGDLVMDSSGNLYGTTHYGGTGICNETGDIPLSNPVNVGCGTIFRIDPSGNEIVVYNFTNSSDGAFPEAGLMLGSDGNLYGTTSSNVVNGAGTVFRFTPSDAPIVSLSVALAGNGTGVVTTNPVGITCGPGCSAMFESGTTITLTATPDSNATLAGWSGACSGTGVCTLTLSANESATATFNLLPPDFSVSAATSAVTLQPGSQQSDTITVAPQNGPFGNTVQLSCSITGPAPMPTCGLAPASVMPGANSATSTLTIDGSGLSAQLVPSLPSTATASTYGLLLSVPGVAMFGFVVFSANGRRKLTLSATICVLAATVVILVSCGAGSSTPPPPKSYTVTVTAAASGGPQHTTQIGVTVP